MNGKQIRFYNVLFPVWMLMVFPAAWLVILPGNFLIDTVVLLLCMKALHLSGKKQLYRQTIGKVWGFGFLADLIGALFLLLVLLIDALADYESAFGLWWYEHMTNAVCLNPFENAFSFLWVTAAVLISAVLIYVFNYHISLKKTALSRTQKKRIALCLAIFTAPWLFYLPSIWLYR